MAAFVDVERLCAQSIPFRMLTILQYQEVDGVVVRVHSSDPAAYPIGGRKRLADFPTNHAAMADGDVFLAATKDDVRRAYADHAALFALGIEAILNVPVRVNGRRLGTLNLCGAEGSFGPEEMARARELAEMLVGVMGANFGS